jgi:peptidoglycan-associated lipoprotein
MFSSVLRRGIPVVAALAFLVLVGCGGPKQMTTPEEEAPADTAAVDTAEVSEQDSLAAAREQARQDSIAAAREAERRRLEQERLEAERAAAAERQAKQNLQVVYFAFDAASIQPEAAEKLQANAEILREYSDWEIIIEGHTDARGSTEYNLALGERRAERVREYYVNLGIAPERLNLISYGEEQPAVEGSGEEVWAKNRRAVTVVK